MIHRQPYPFKPSRMKIFSMLVSKLTTLLNNSLAASQVKQLHALVLVNGLNHLEPVLITQIISTQSNYSQSTSHYLRSLLRHSKHPDHVSRTSVVCFFYQHGQFQEALTEYAQIRRSGLLPTTFAVVSALKACARLGNWIGGITIHAQAHEYGFCGDVHVGSALVGFYKKFDDEESAKRVFDEMSERNAASWVIDRYLELGNLSMAERLFSEMPNKDVASWNSMVLWYTKKGDMEKAISSFGPMPVKNPASWNAMINGCVDLGKMEIARNFYDVMPRRNTTSCVTMIGGYSKCGDVESAREIFYEMDQKDHLLYNAMITCYSQNSRPREALQLFDEMLQPNLNIQPDNMTLATILSVCSQVRDFSFGIWIEESLMKKMDIRMDDCLRTAFIELYAKCGRLENAYRLFYGLTKKNDVAYTMMILACGMNGRKLDAIKLFEEMLEAKICPKLSTFSGLLNALNNVGMDQENQHVYKPTSSILPPPRPFDHVGMAQESHHGFKPTSSIPPSPPRPFDHVGMVQESYHGFNYISSMPTPRPFNQVRMVQESDDGFNLTRPISPPSSLKHVGVVQESYHGFSHASSTPPLRSFIHVGYVQERYQRFNHTSSTPPPMSFSHVDLVQESHHGSNPASSWPPPMASNHVKESYHGFNHACWTYFL